jgi:hypothetical protein
MKKTMNILAKAVLFISMLAITQIALADDPGNPGDILGGGGSGTNAEGVPLDGGASLLIASGVAYGVRTMRKRKAAQKA